MYEELFPGFGGDVNTLVAPGMDLSPVVAPNPVAMKGAVKLVCWLLPTIDWLSSLRLAAGGRSNTHQRLLSEAECKTCERTMCNRIVAETP